MKEEFSPQELNQTDFGKLHFNVPSCHYEPSTIEELATVLKKENEQGNRVTIRNTGHSVNGQTLTSGVQISIGKIKEIKFDKENLQVRVKAGNSWDEMLKAIDFPDYCTPVFPQNPDQQIHVTGTAAVGGIGIYAYGRGGVWNWVREITLVTMEGEILKCSPEVNSDIFYYSLGGFGRLGVIAEVVLAVEKSPKETLILAIVHHNLATAKKNLDQILKCPDLDGVIFQKQLTQVDMLERVGIEPTTIVVMKEIKEGETIETVADALRATCHPEIGVYVVSDEGRGIEFTLRHRTMPKQDVVYYYPKNHEHQLSIVHPWVDFVLPLDAFEEFANKAGDLIVSYGVAPYLTKESLFHDSLDMDWFGGYVIKNSSPPENKFPLAFELQNVGKYSVAFGIQPAVPREMIPSCLEMIQKLDDLAYSLGGKKYLYGVHNLTKDQINKQFGAEVVEKWSRLKKKFDPKNLLNIEAIENLD